LGREVAPRLLLRCGLGRDYDGRVDCVNWDRGRGRRGFGCRGDDDCFAWVWAGLGVDARSPVGIRVRARRVFTLRDFLGTGFLFHPSDL
jgi:hypothetical protein